MNYQIREARPANEGQSDELQPFIGRKLDAAFILPDGMFFSFEGGAIIQATATSAVGEISHGIMLKIGDTKPGTDWREVLRGHTPDDPRLETLRGLPFRGMDIDVFQFGEEFGVQITPVGIRFVRDAAKRKSKLGSEENKE